MEIAPASRSESVNYLGNAICTCSRWFLPTERTRGLFFFKSAVWDSLVKGKLWSHTLSNSVFALSYSIARKLYFGLIPKGLPPTLPRPLCYRVISSIYFMDKKQLTCIRIIVKNCPWKFLQMLVITWIAICFLFVHIYPLVGSIEWLPRINAYPPSLIYDEKKLTERAVDNWIWFV